MPLRFGERRAAQNGVGGVNNNKFYDILGVTKDADSETLRKAYRRSAIKNHPDKGGDPEKFKELSHAYEVLSDPDKRQVYDAYGEEGLKDGIGGNASMHDPTDLFDTLFGGGFGRSFGGSRDSSARQRRGEDIVYPLKVTLEDLYNGTVRKLALTRNVLCAKCNGTGSRSGKSSVCGGCQGSGMKVTIRQFGPGMIQQMRTTCGECGGSGEAVQEKDKCRNCHGAKVLPEKKTLEVHVTKGMCNGEKIRFQQQADEAPDSVPGDIVFVLQQQAHERFKRMGDDLIMEHTLTLTEALCGFQVVVTHLDGRQLLLKNQAGEVIHPNQFKAIDEEGMPLSQNPFLKGRLFVRFKVDFPASGSLSPDQVAMLACILPPGPTSMLDPSELEQCEETTLVDVDMAEEMRRKEEAAREAMEEEQARNGPSVQCAQQ